jgi:hypothetical protein
MDAVAGRVQDQRRKNRKIAHQFLRAARGWSAPDAWAFPMVSLAQPNEKRADDDETVRSTFKQGTPQGNLPLQKKEPLKRQNQAAACDNPPGEP